MINDNQLKVLAFGEILYDVIGGDEHLGGAPLNFAAHISRLGAQASILSAVGCDDRGERAINELTGYGIGCDYVLRSLTHPTGVVNVELTTDGQPSYNILEGAAYDNIDYTPRQISSILDQSWDAFYFGTLAQRSLKSRQCLCSMLDEYTGGMVFCDINLRQDYYSKQVIDQSLYYADVVKINDQEQRVLSQLLYGQILLPQDFYKKLATEYGTRLLVVTCGALGCDLFDGNDVMHCDGINVDVVDTVGAGDAFSAAFVYNNLIGTPLDKSIAIANRLGAYVAGKRGAIPLYDTVNA